MTEQTDIQELKDDIKEMKDFPIKLTWAKLWTVLVIIAGVIGSAFGFGIRVQFEVSKLEMAEQQQEYNKSLNLKEMELLESNRKQRENFENMTFFQNQYTVYVDRYNKCLNGEVYTEKK